MLSLKIHSYLLVAGRERRQYFKFFSGFVHGECHVKRNEESPVLNGLLSCAHKDEIEVHLCNELIREEQ